MCDVIFELFFGHGKSCLTSIQLIPIHTAYESTSKKILIIYTKHLCYLNNF